MSLILLTLFACNKNGSIFGSEDTADSGVPWWVDEYDYEGDDPPEARLGDAWCEMAQGSAGDIFYFSVEGFDKQGESSITGGSVIAKQDGSTLFDHPLLYCDDNGDCEGSWTAASWSGELACNETAVGAYTFRAYLTDDEGNDSEKVTLDWKGVIEPSGGGD
ncbi:MAG: hypothetical protein VX899_10165 [Myxococcota bacterium]|nr:hypothetical protein [Myxococcota bacterium]